MCAVLSHTCAIHAHGVIHRYLKPANILMSPLGGSRVIDFGIARPAGVDLTRLTHAGWR
jgi:serine/threonine protein kinase